jgi:predicted metalloprotease
MKFVRGYRSSNVEDRRGQSGPMRYGGRLGLGGVVIVLVLLGARYLFGVDVLSGSGQGGAPAGGGAPVADDPELVSFVSYVLDDAQATWDKLFAGKGRRYQAATLVLFTDATDTACGYGDAAIGPFYCPPDRKVYIDLGFYRDLRERFGAPGDFAQAYVIAHEIGHHVQTLLGTSDEMRRAQQREPGRKNELSVRLELQADCYAGVWAHATARRDLLEKGDVEEGLTAASAIGDDRLQKMARGRVSPESFTHGSSAQRVRWFKRGFEAGTLEACDTFSISEP